MNCWPLTVLILVGFSCGVFGQKRPVFQTEAGVLVGSSGQVPFWHQSNKFGGAPNSLPALTSQLHIFSRPIARVDSLGKRRLFDWNYGLETVGNLSSKSNLVLIQGYLAVRLGSFQLHAGRKRELFGLLDTLLTTGAVSYSGNALPIPKLQLATNGFVDVPFTKQLLAFQGTFAHGWLGQQRISPNYFPIGIKIDYYGHYLNTYFHQKTFYGRFGKPYWKINLYGGFNHQAFWGNEQQIWTWSDLTLQKSYKYVVFGLIWEQSKVGNHFGTIDVAAKIKGKKWDLFLYRQSIYDTGSLLNAFNLDALNGISFQNKTPNKRKLYIQKLLFEYLYTNDQREPLLDPLGAGIGNGRNDYFNHYIYLDGWSYKKRVLGTPFAVIDRNVKENVNNSDFKGGYILNNKIQAVHFGLSGIYNARSHFILLNSFSKNQGTYGIPFEVARYQFSSSFTVQQAIPGFKNTIGKISIATDLGSLYRNQVGIFANVQKTW